MVVSTKDEPTMLFVYGTLKEGCCNNDLLLETGCKLVQKDSVQGYTLWSIGRGVGALKSSSQLAYSYGEVYTITPKALQECDIIEGVAHGNYIREEVLTEGKLRAWIYYKVLHSGQRWYNRIIGGSWYEDMNFDTEMQELGNEQPARPKSIACDTRPAAAVVTKPYYDAVELCYGTPYSASKMRVE